MAEKIQIISENSDARNKQSAISSVQSQPEQPKVSNNTSATISTAK